MTDELTAPSDEPEATPAEEVAPEDRTGAQVEELKSRLSGKDKALTAALQRVADLEKAATQRTEAQEEARRATMTSEERWAEEKRQLEQQIEQERAARVIETRKAKFPSAAETLGDSAMAAMDEERIAALESRLSSKPASRVDPNSAPRTPSQEPTGEKSLADLEADMRKLEPAWQEAITNPYG